jgi:hypothetical protein
MTTNTKLNELDFLKMADTLNQSEQYRVITKYCHTSVILGQLSGNNISYTVPPHRQLKSHICN